MRFSLAALSGLVALVSARCGTVAHPRIKAHHALYQSLSSNTSSTYKRQAAEDQVITTFFYVITQNNTVEGGNVTQDAIDQQVSVLNKAYADTGFSFVANDTFYVPAPAWRDLEQFSETEYNMKRALRRGDYATLNIYLTSIAETPDGQPLGYATFPDKANKRAFAVDGVVVSQTTLPGGSQTPYNTGITLVHEVGHWLSLLHTFEPGDKASANDELRGCRGDGDFILDTPAEATAAFGCQEDRDTCTGDIEDDNDTSQPGPDPVHNYMDYSDDACLTTFTDGQVERMMKSFVDLRLNYVQGDEGEQIDPEQGHSPEDQSS